MATKSTKSMYVCDNCLDKCAYCGTVEKNMHNNCNYASRCKACADAYKDTTCAICGGKLQRQGRTVHRCTYCTKETKKCFKCGAVLK